MRKDDKKTSKSKRPKKAETKDLTVRNSGTVKGGKVTVHDISLTKYVDKASSSLMY